MPRNYQEFRCDKCGDLFFAEWKRLCTLCDPYLEERRKAVEGLYEMDEQTAKRVQRELDEAIKHEADPSWMRGGRRSMWQGHKE